MSRHTLSVLVENKPGVLARIAGLFSRRGLNIDSDTLRRRGLQWAEWHNGRSGRTARQFIDHLAGELGLADGHDQYVGRSRDRSQIRRAAVADGDRGVDAALDEHHGQWLADNVAAADDHDMPAGDLDAAADQYFIHSGRSAGQKSRPA